MTDDERRACGVTEEELSILLRHDLHLGRCGGIFDDKGHLLMDWEHIAGDDEAWGAPMGDEAFESRAEALRWLDGILQEEEDEAAAEEALEDHGC